MYLTTLPSISNFYIFVQALYQNQSVVDQMQSVGANSVPASVHTSGSKYYVVFFMLGTDCFLNTAIFSQVIEAEDCFRARRPQLIWSLSQLVNWAWIH